MSEQAKKYNQTIGENHKDTARMNIENAVTSLQSFLKFESPIFLLFAERSIKTARNHWAEGTSKHGENLETFLTKQDLQDWHICPECGKIVKWDGAYVSCPSCGWNERS